jgi:hypothetical protein
MIEIPSTKENLANFFYYWVNLYDNKRFPDFEAVYQFVLKEGEKTFHYYISVSKGKAEYHEGEHKSPSIKIYKKIPVEYRLALLGG